MTKSNKSSAGVPTSLHSDNGAASTLDTHDPAALYELYCRYEDELQIGGKKNETQFAIWWKSLDDQSRQYLAGVFRSGMGAKIDETAAFFKQCREKECAMA